MVSDFSFFCKIVESQNRKSTVISYLSLFCNIVESQNQKSTVVSYLSCICNIVELQNQKRTVVSYLSCFCNIVKLQNQKSTVVPAFFLLLWPLSQKKVFALQKFFGKLKNLKFEQIYLYTKKRLLLLSYCITSEKFILMECLYCTVYTVLPTVL